MSDPKPNNDDVIEFPFEGLTLKPTVDQFKAWRQTAGDVPIEEWLANMADDAAVRLSYDERTFPVVIQLKTPVRITSTVELTELSMREGRLSDMQGIKIGGEINTDDLVKIAARMSGQAPTTISKLGARDAGEVMAIALEFFGRCLGAGKRRSQ
jgi:hypothetical protein